MTAPAAVSMRDVTVSYTRGNYVVTPVDRLSLDVEPGSLVLLLGPSGCGKTTLLSCLAGIQKPAGGHIFVDGADITTFTEAQQTSYRRHGVGVVFQAFNLIPSLTALGNVMVPLRSAGVSRKQAHQRATELLEAVGLADRLDHLPSGLSGGQQQRVAIARALALEPKLVLADEPTANLDARQVESVLRVLRSLCDRGHTVVVATHDHRLLALADRVVDLAAIDAPKHPSGARTILASAGEILFAEGERGDEIFEVTSGAVELRRRDRNGEEVLLGVCAAGDCFGEMGPLFELPRSATAIASEESVVVARDVAEFRSVHGASKLRDLVGRSLGPAAD